MSSALPDSPTNRNFQTLAHAVTQDGIGLHSGQPVRVKLCPRAETGIVFVRTDLTGAPEIAASLHHIARTTHATSLEQNGVSVGTTEHLLAALWALGITHCRIEIDAAEVPILDGSAQGWCQLIEQAGVTFIDSASRSTSIPARPLWGLREPVGVFAGQSAVLGLPHSSFRLSAAVEFATQWNSKQEIDLEITAASFIEALAPARTFTLEEWIEPLRAQGLIRGGSTENALILDAEGASAPWRFPNELARHKALDVVGDLALMFAQDGGWLQAHIIAIKAGHDLHRAWMHECLQREMLVKRHW
jgi:UDP-3-O-[3-hydroxymyristoyl] N-acetylglucosamine deacetylase